MNISIEKTVTVIVTVADDILHKAIRLLKGNGYNITNGVDLAKGMETLGERLKVIRYCEGLTQQQLSERTGISVRHISEMENGRHKINKEYAKTLAEVLNTKPTLFLKR